MIQTIIKDMTRKAEWYELPTNTKSILRMLLSDGSTAQILYRAMRFCQKRRLGLLAIFFYRWNASVGHAIIGRNAEIAPGFVMLHSIGVVINSSVRAGINLTIEHGVTIGSEKNKSPILGNNVFIGAGAKIIGPVTIGSNVKIGANAVVVHDLPDGATAVGVPARVVRIYGEKVGGAEN
jgi:serine O-acetyltransferase